MNPFNKRRKSIAIFLLLTILVQLCLPLQVYALTGGPSQPEVQSFEPVGTTDMVDLFTGDFNYNIPLLDVEGYPINIAYHSGITMDQEASWVGLGWNINPGVINRNMRGLPDDFKGEEIKQIFDTKPHITRGLNAGVAWELFGSEMKKKLPKLKKGSTSSSSALNLGLNLGIKYDNYRGMGYSLGVSPSLSISETITNNQSENKNTPVTQKNSVGLDLNFDSQDGMGISGNYSQSKSHDVTKNNLSGKTTDSKSASLGFNSRSGFIGLTLGVSTNTNTHGKVNNKSVQSITGSSNGGTFLMQNHPSYQPNAKNKLNTQSYSVNFKLGTEWWATNPEIDLGGYYTAQKYNTSRTVYGYGTMYNHNKPVDSFLMDFNRYNEGSYSNTTTNLPLSTVTSDYFSVSGQGIGGAYKAKQSYVPIVYDDEVYSNSTALGLGGELGVPAILKLGINASAVFTSNRNGVKKLNENEKRFLSYENIAHPVDYEFSYFKNVGEKTPIVSDFYNKIRTTEVFKPSDIGISKRITNMLWSKHNYYLENFDISKIGSLPSYVINDVMAILDEKAVMKEREKRNQVFQYLTVSQIQKVPELALDSLIKSYPLNSLECVWNPSTLVTTSRHNIQTPNQISEVNVLADDGRRYVYGIPSMNKTQREYTFSVEPNPVVTNQIATYSTTVVDSINYMQDSIKVNYVFHQQNMPAYAHSYLLTGILSDDYIDRTNNGITDDDYGTAVKFNYTKADALYHWRTPYPLKSANYQEGMKSNPNDNKASFVYGEKEVWYMHSIETKNFVAVFIMSARADGLGVTGRNGGMNTADTLKKLDRIVLYSKTDLIKNHEAAIPIKTVHFVYDYSQCKNVDNNSAATIMVDGVNINANKGKLTLKKIYFTYGKSNKGMYTSYRFSYCEPNPNYNIKGYDRWGNYAEVKPSSSTTPNNSEWPFTSQFKSNADSSAAAWNLSKIELPTGGVINVTYECDDYAYVQEKQAQMMVKMLDIGETSTDYQANETQADLYDGTKNKNFIFFKIPQTTQSIPIANYFKGIDNLYFNLRSIIREKLISNAYPEEDIDGFCEIVKDENNEPECGVLAGDATIGWVHIKEVSVKDDDNKKSKQKLQPMAKQAFIYAVQNTPEQVYPGSNPNATGEAAYKGLLSSFGEIASLVKSCYKIMRDRNYCKKVVLGKSFIRINCASKIKLGGGNRVKKIELDDKWSDMKNSSNSNVVSSSYGQEYDYKIIEGTDTISSGVAQWEPTIGGNENPYRLPIWEVQKRYAGRDQKTLHMEPVAEALYPSPNVGYSKITVKSLGGKTGRTETTFYTARDFPTKVIITSLDKNTSDNPIFQVGNKVANIGLAAASNASKTKAGSGLGLDINYNYLKVQQGYTIINNDMHGKMREQHIYPQGSNTARSSVKYNYKTDSKDKTKLENKVLTYNHETNEVKEQTVGVDFDVSYDKQAEQTITGSAKLQFNNDNFMVVPLPVASISFFLGLGFNLNDFKYDVVTKQVNQYAILESTEVFEDGSTINTKNLLYDAHTGEVLLTETQNEFNDKIYNLSYPAHFAYDGMGQAYKNINIAFSNINSATNGALYFTNSLEDWKISQYLVPGDEVSLKENTTYTKAWIHKLQNSQFCLIDAYGEILKDKNYSDLQVIRSGRKNMQNIPIGGISLLKNPLVYAGGNWSLSINDQNVLNISAVTFSDEWETFCESSVRLKCLKQTDAGRGIKLWLNKITKDTVMTQNSIYESDEIPPQLFRDILFCDSNTNTSTNYTVDTNAVSASGTLNYIIKSGEGDVCCNISLKSDYKNCISYPVNRYMIMFPSNNLTFYLNGTTYLLDDFEPFGADSIIEADTCDLVGDSIVCHPYTYIFRSYYVSKNIYDSLINYSDITNYIYKRNYSFDSVVCNYIRYNRLDSSSIYPVSIDTTTFETNGTLKNFKVVATLSNGKKTLLTGNIECDLPLYTDCCDDCIPPDTKIINPYLEGVRGVWRKKADYAYHAKRNLTYTSTIATPKIRKDGVFDAYYPFWEYSSSADRYIKATGTNWQKANEVTVYNPFGNEIENKDALGIYSSAIFGYNYRLPIAVAKNTKYTQLAYDGFEDYGLYMAWVDCPKSHWSFEWNESLASVTDSFAHSGKNSLKVPASQNALVSRKIVNCTNANSGIESDEYILEACNCIKLFSPDTGDYIIGGWLREQHGAMQAVTSTYDSANVTIVLKKQCLDSDSIVIVLHASGPVLEEWQRVEEMFHIPAGYPIVEVYLNAPSYTAWFDDLRIHPFQGNMKSYAYDQTSLRLMAELDENNFATFYEYDQEGQLMRVKKETVKGIVTLKEVRSHSSTR